MQPIIQRTLTITIVETWTIIWPDGHQTTWQATEEVVWPVAQEPSEPTPRVTVTDDAPRDDDAGEQAQPDG